MGIIVCSVFLQCIRDCEQKELERGSPVSRFVDQQIILVHPARFAPCQFNLDPLAAFEEQSRSARAAIRDLEIAIAALASKQDSAASGPRPKRRGELRRAVVDCLRQRIGRVSKIRAELASRGITTTGPSISNVLNRLHQDKIARPDLTRGGSKPKSTWVLVEQAQEQGSPAVLSAGLQLNGSSGASNLSPGNTL